MEFHLIPKYKATDVVEALKIKEVRLRFAPNGTRECVVLPEDERFGEFSQSLEYYEVQRPKPGHYWVRHEDGKTGCYPPELVEKHYRPATALTPELLKNVRAVVASDLVSDEEISTINQMVMSELIDENRGVIGGPDVIHMQHPARLAEAVIELVLNKLAAIPA